MGESSFFFFFFDEHVEIRINQGEVDDDFVGLLETVYLRKKLRDRKRCIIPIIYSSF